MVFKCLWSDVLFCEFEQTQPLALVNQNVIRPVCQYPQQKSNSATHESAVIGLTPGQIPNGKEYLFWDRYHTNQNSLHMTEFTDTSKSSAVKIILGVDRRKSHTSHSSGLLYSPSYANCKQRKARSANEPGAIAKSHHLSPSVPFARTHSRTYTLTGKCTFHASVRDRDCKRLLWNCCPGLNWFIRFGPTNARGD